MGADEDDRVTVHLLQERQCLGDRRAVGDLVALLDGQREPPASGSTVSTQRVWGLETMRPTPYGRRILGERGRLLTADAVERAKGVVPCQVSWLPALAWRSRMIGMSGRPGVGATAASSSRSRA